MSVKKSFIILQLLGSVIWSLAIWGIYMAIYYLPSALGWSVRTLESTVPNQLAGIVPTPSAEILGLWGVIESNYPIIVSISYYVLWGVWGIGMFIVFSFMPKILSKFK
jgi:hypothetical protein